MSGSGGIGGLDASAAASGARLRAETRQEIDREQRSPAVMVLLSAYNGGQYIAEQIESIRAQSLRDWKLVVRDDGSRDDTVRIVRSFIAEDPRISLLEDSSGNLGPWASFGKLLAYSYDRGAEYIFLSDQDDVWATDKLEQQLSLLEAARLRSGAGHSVLVHSDLEVVAADLVPIHPSFSEFQRMTYHAADPLRTLLIHNAIAGCTIGINRPLLEAALPLPPGTLHDWWLAVCAAAGGTILRTPAATVRYRQHASNVVGAPPRHGFLGSLLRHPRAYAASAFREFGSGVEQALHLRDRMRLARLGGTRELRRVERYCDAFADDRSVIARLRALRDSKARPQRAVSRAIMYGIVVSYPTVRSFLDRSRQASGR